jgi:hypothetical protein
MQLVQTIDATLDYPADPEMRRDRADDDSSFAARGRAYDNLISGVLQKSRAMFNRTGMVDPTPKLGLSHDS